MNASTPSTAAILGDAAWLAHRYDPVHDAFHYRPVPRDRRGEIPFLTDDCLGPAEAAPVIARAEAAAATAPGQVHFIFHSAFCASTMLVHALDRPGIATGLSEPVVLNDLVGWRRRGAEPRRHGRVLHDALAQLARPFRTGEAAVIKPSNILNPLAAGILTLRPDARALLLYAPLPVFLASVARKGLWCRLWVRELLEGYLTDGVVDLGFGPRDVFRQTDLQVAAVGWLAQHVLFHTLAERFGDARIRTFDSEKLAAAPEAATAAVARHFGLGRVVGSHPAFRRDSKIGGDFASDQRSREQSLARAAHAEEIDRVMDWAGVVASRAGIALSLPYPLHIPA